MTSSEAQTSSNSNAKLSSSFASSSAGGVPSAEIVSGAAEPSIYCQTAGNCGSFTDARDGQVYNWTKIGSQTWMAQNLNYSGDNGSGARTYTKGWCYGMGDADTTQHQDRATCGNGYGRFYFWTDAMDIGRSYLITTATAVINTPHRGLCPSGWHIPDTTDWNALAAFLQTDQSVPEGYEGKYLKAIVAGNMDWNDSRYNAQDPYGFSALPAGQRQIYAGWGDRSEYAYFWLATNYGSNNAYYCSLNHDKAEFCKSLSGREYSYSIRCIKDAS